MTNDRIVLLIGGGGHAAVVADAARTAGWKVAGYLDDDADVTPALPVPRLGTTHEVDAALSIAGPRAFVHAATGDATLRRRWLDRVALLRSERDLSSGPATIVHASAVVSPSAHLGEGVFVGAGAVINARARIERGVLVNTRAVVEHDCVVGAFAHLAPGAVLAGQVIVGEETLVGIGAIVNPGRRLGHSAILGAGAVAVSDIPDAVCAAGVPARALRPVRDP